MKIRTFQMEAMTELAPGADWYIGSDKILVWRDNNVEKPTDSAIETKMAELKAEFTANEYARNRKAEYDALNQFELMSDDAINGTTTHKDAIAAIKTKYPKG